MAECFKYKIKGYAVRGNETIYPNRMWEPEQHSDDEINYVYFTHLVKGVTDDAKQCIQSDGGFKGNLKKYGEDIYGASLCGRFSWWSVYIDNDTANRIKSEMGYGQEPAPIYEGGSRYGTNLFKKELDELILTYEESIKERSEIRVLATFEYDREVQNALVVVPRKSIPFKDHDLIARRKKNGNYIWLQGDSWENHDYDAEYIWYPFSTIQWDNYAKPPKQRKWAHLAFAFYLDPLPNKIMSVPGVDNDTNWTRCNWQGIRLDTQFEP